MKYAEDCQDVFGNSCIINLFGEVTPKTTKKRDVAGEKTRRLMNASLGPDKNAEAGGDVRLTAFPPRVRSARCRSAHHESERQARVAARILSGPKLAFHRGVGFSRLHIPFFVVFGSHLADMWLMMQEVPEHVLAVFSVFS